MEYDVSGWLPLPIAALSDLTARLKDTSPIPTPSSNLTIKCPLLLRSGPSWRSSAAHTASRIVFLKAPPLSLFLYLLLWSSPTRCRSRWWRSSHSSIFCKYRSPPPPLWSIHSRFRFWPESASRLILFPASIVGRLSLSGWTPQSCYWFWRGIPSPSCRIFDWLTPLHVWSVSRGSWRCCYRPSSKKEPFWVGSPNWQTQRTLPQVASLSRGWYWSLPLRWGREIIIAWGRAWWFSRSRAGRGGCEMRSHPTVERGAPLPEKVQMTL